MKNGDLTHSKTVLTEPQFKQLAHLPLLTVFYLFFQRQFSATPVTALELAAYLGIDVKIAEGALSFLDQVGIVRAFKNDLPAYSLGKELDQISVKDLVSLLAEFHELLKKEGGEPKALELEASNEKYRKIYSELASEILQLFGQESANQLPL
jgi:DNA-binding IscR family transcriptional regulator